jgi:glyoxylase-like metal-dependent hydrolase (beta-lactamase superfamily II)
MDFVPDVRVKDGDVLNGNGFTFECVHTPGHTSNHMCFALKEEQALFTGDHIMGWSTTVVTPPDGDMAQYMDSVRKLEARGDKTLYPTHGAPVTAPKPFLAAYLAHRVDRENQVLACLKDGLDTIPAMVERMYAAVDKGLWPAASRSVLAHLIKLEHEGRVTNEGSRYRIAA